MQPLSLVAAITALVIVSASADPGDVEAFTPKSVVDHGWHVVNDGVMGGLSKGRFKVCEAGILSFSGTLSLENNGGFSSIRSHRLKHDLSAAKGVKLRVRGDGRSYQLRFATDARHRGGEISFKAEFTAPAGRWAEIFIPFSDFSGSFRGMELPKAPFNPAEIQRVGLLIADKKPGVFQLEVDWIRSADH